MKTSLPITYQGESEIDDHTLVLTASLGNGRFLWNCKTGEKEKAIDNPFLPENCL